MICARFAFPTVVLLALALMPTLRDTYAAAKEEDGRVTGAISESLAGLSSKPTSRSATWGREAFASGDWIERRYTGSANDEVVLTVVRSYDFKRLYHHPELSAAYGHDLRNLGTHRSAAMPHVPVNVLRPPRSSRPGLAAYSLHYGDEFVDGVYGFQLRVGWELLFTSRKQMTLFFIYQSGFPPTGSVERSVGIAVLSAAIRDFLAQPATPRGATAGSL